MLLDRPMLAVLLVLGACDWAPFEGDDDDDDDPDPRDASVLLDSGADPDAGTDSGLDASVDVDAAVGRDAGPCDEVECTVAPDPTCLDDTTLRTSSAPGLCVEGECRWSTSDVPCGRLGCCTDHCCVVVPSNGEAMGELEPTGLELDAADVTFDTDGDCTDAAVLGSCAPSVQGEAPEVCVCRMDVLSLGSVEIVGPRALAILAWESVTVDGVVQVSARGDVPGPGASSVSYEVGGTAGGSYGTLGGNGGAAAWGGERLTPLVGGMDGQDRCAGSEGGGGGGALQITAGISIDVTGTIHAGGGGGDGGSSLCPYGGPGGGSGGAILLEAPEVLVTGILAANGGGGGGSDGTVGSGGRGGDALASDAAAWGGWGADDGGYGCPLYGYWEGGDGGSGSAGDASGSWGQSANGENRCLSGNGWVGQGGGGGGAGRIRINSDEDCTCAGTESPSSTFGPVESR